MVTKAVANSMLFLRIVTLAASAATVALLFTNKVKFDDGSKLRFQDFYAYRQETPFKLVWIIIIINLLKVYCIIFLHMQVCIIIFNNIIEISNWYK